MIINCPQIRVNYNWIPYIRVYLIRSEVKDQMLIENFVEAKISEDKFNKAIKCRYQNTVFTYHHSVYLP